MTADAPTDGGTDRSRLRLVLLDNDPAVLDLLVLDLGLEGHDILGSFTQRDAAIEACERERPDVFVVDLRLGPGPDGIDVAARVAHLGHRAVLYTNYINADIVGRAKRVGLSVVEKGSLAALRRAVVGSEVVALD